MSIPFVAAFFVVPCLAIALVAGPQSHRSEGEQASFFACMLRGCNFFDNGFFSSAV